jgi:hypothetical protein
MSEVPATFTVFITAPIEIRSEANLRQHWRHRHERTKAQKQAVAWMLRGLRPPVNPTAITVTITRVGGRRLDTDNLAGGCKHARDAVARWIGVDDGDSRYTFVYAQRNGKTKCAEIHIAWESACAASPANAL